MLKGRFAPGDSNRNECAEFREGFANDHFRRSADPGEARGKL